MVKATIEDVAVKAGVSVATVNRVLNGRAQVRPDNAKLVAAAIRSLNYHPDRLASRLSKARDYRFCFVLPRGDNDFMHSLDAEITGHAQHLASERVVADILYTDVFDPMRWPPPSARSQDTTVLPLWRWIIREFGRQFLI